jgi:hypothetical protein
MHQSTRYKAAHFADDAIAADDGGKVLHFARPHDRAMCFSA